ncbi:hypothetical protein [Streptomyces sp. NPDC006446]|uniref:DUF6192 family protein n=1 Tax=Streptomyces sp. NPDC006446 TaxID=3154301 RepID=UPI0033B46294
MQQEAAPQLQRMEHSAQFMDLVAACAQFVATRPLNGRRARPAAGRRSRRTGCRDAAHAHAPEPTGSSERPAEAWRPRWLNRSRRSRRSSWSD